MQALTDIGENLVNQVSSRYGLSRDAVVHMLIAVNNGGGSMAQFNCPELGGSGQWMQGGMTMVGDMFNGGLKATVDNLCNELAMILSNNEVFPTIPAGMPGSNQWWPEHLGTPFSSGSQNNIRYSIFPNRLAIEIDGQVSVYDTLDHNIGGISQQQSNNASFTFSSQWGTVDLNSLPLISGQATTTPEIHEPQPNTYESEPVNTVESVPQDNANTANQAAQYSVNETLDIIDKLAQLRDQGVLTDDEFNAKKSELLTRI